MGANQKEGFLRQKRGLAAVKEDGTVGAAAVLMVLVIPSNTG